MTSWRSAVRVSYIPTFLMQISNLYSHSLSQRNLFLLFIEAFSKAVPHTEIASFQLFDWGFACHLTDPMKGGGLLLQVVEEEIRRIRRDFSYDLKTMVSSCVDGYLAAEQLALIGELPEEVVDLFLLPSGAIALPAKEEKSIEPVIENFDWNECNHFALFAHGSIIFGFVTQEKKSLQALRKLWQKVVGQKDHELERAEFERIDFERTMIDRKQQAELINQFEESCKQVGLTLPTQNSLYAPNVLYSEIVTSEQKNLPLYSYALHPTIQDPVFWDYPEGHNLQLDIPVEVHKEALVIEQCIRATTKLFERLQIPIAVRVSGGSKRLEALKAVVVQGLPAGFEIGEPVAKELQRPGYLLIEFFTLDQLLRPTVCSVIQVGLQRKSESIGCTCTAIPYVGVERVCQLLYHRV